MGCGESSIHAEVGLLEDCPGAKPRLHLPENVVDTVLNAEISRDGPSVDMDEKITSGRRSG